MAELKAGDEGVKQFESGAIRSNDADDVRYDLITPIGLRRLAETYAEGGKRYGDDNWLKGMPAAECLNHCIKHIEQWRSGDRSEDHLAHAAWNLFAIMHFEETRPDLMTTSYDGVSSERVQADTQGTTGGGPPDSPQPAS